FIGGFWEKRNFDRGEGNAGSDGDPRKVRATETAFRRAHHGLAAHDDPDSRVDRNADGSWRKRALGELQYFLDARSCRSSDRQARYLRFRVERRIAGGLLAVHVSRNFTPGR